MSRGLRNCNPGNIRISGTKYDGEVQPSQDKAFKQFKSMEYGYRAMFVLLHTYRKKHGCDTLRKMINRYAPPTENHTDTYIQNVAKWAKVDPEQKMDTMDQRTMVPVVCAMAHVENGVPAVQSDVVKGWNLFKAAYRN